jgi:hypothetical protein
MDRHNLAMEPHNLDMARRRSKDTGSLSHSLAMELLAMVKPQDKCNSNRDTAKVIRRNKEDIRNNLSLASMVSQASLNTLNNQVNHNRNTLNSLDNSNMGNMVNQDNSQGLNMVIFILTFSFAACVSETFIRSYCSPRRATRSAGSISVQLPRLWRISYAWILIAFVVNA